MQRMLGDPARHFFMTRGVARVMGLNLGAAMACGTLDPHHYEEMVTRCRGCALVEACEEWLSARVEVSAAPPPGCCNAATLSRLKAGR
ncbi:DUF6455 family protein [Sagittula salina]|uniref:DUF6455 domain-containing protein n=1 Tax=Sagittula salina TaxID=2820268 RepID=A0A940S0W7_9RHOB|nr:DUF6455 family protein [Sagittula salina]MBP0482447.1 hypothetical protein [Sagittula salina]